jgi:hypothetical protein
LSRPSDTPDPPDWAEERWQRSPLKREAVVRIFDATTGGRFDLAPAVLPHREALYLTLADLAAVLIEYGSRPGYATPAQAKRVDRTLRAYVAALSACSDTREPPLMLAPVARQSG